jgi:hypothetical protein
VLRYPQTEAAQTGTVAQMTDTDEHRLLRAARQAAREAAKTAADLATFVDRLSPVLDPAQRAEYAALLAHDEEARLRREETLAALDVTVPSISEDG